MKIYLLRLAFNFRCRCWLFWLPKGLSFETGSLGVAATGVVLPRRLEAHKRLFQAEKCRNAPSYIP